MINSIFQNDLDGSRAHGLPRLRPCVWPCGTSWRSWALRRWWSCRPGCWSTFVGLYPSTTLRVPVMSVPFATTAATASGVRASLDRQGRRGVTVLAWAGDGGTFDIGLQALSGATERAH